MVCIAVTRLCVRYPDVDGLTLPILSNTIRICYDLILLQAFLDCECAVHKLRDMITICVVFCCSTFSVEDRMKFVLLIFSSDIYIMEIIIFSFLKLFWHEYGFDIQDV